MIPDKKIIAYLTDNDGGDVFEDDGGGFKFGKSKNKKPSPQESKSSSGDDDDEDSCDCEIHRNDGHDDELSFDAGAGRPVRQNLG